jgi:MFS family permease
MRDSDFGASVTNPPGETVAPDAAVAPLAAAPAAALPRPSTEVSDSARRRASLSYSIKDGLAWSVMHGAGERYVLPFIILESTGLLKPAGMSALPLLVGAVAQCFAAELTDSVGQRKKIFVRCSTVQALMFIPMIVAVFLSGSPGYALMLAAYLLFIATHNLSVPAWISLMGDLVPEQQRGRYFGLRNALIGGGILSSFLAAGYWLTFCKNAPSLALFGLSAQNFGFIALFALACGMRLLSVWYLTHMHEPPYHREESDRFTLWEFLVRAPRAHFGRFVFYCGLLNVGIGFLGPFFGWYMLDELHFTPFAFAAVLTVQLAAYFGFQWFWGRLADRIGNKRVLAIGGIGMSIIPVLLMVSDRFGWFVLVQLYDGLVSAAYAIAAANYLYDIVTPPKRVRCTAYNNLFVMGGMALGTLSGALVATYVPTPLHIVLPTALGGGLTISHPFTLLLLGSAILRLLPSLLLLGTFEEFRLKRPGVYADSPGPA